MYGYGTLEMYSVCGYVLERALVQNLIMLCLHGHNFTSVWDCTSIKQLSQSIIGDYIFLDVHVLS